MTTSFLATPFWGILLRILAFANLQCLSEMIVSFLSTPLFLSTYRNVPD